MSNDIKINGALHDIIEYMEEDGCSELGEPIKHNGKKYYATIELIEKDKLKAMQKGDKKNGTQ